MIASICNIEKRSQNTSILPAIQFMYQNINCLIMYTSRKQVFTDCERASVTALIKLALPTVLKGNFGEDLLCEGFRYSP